MSIFLFRFPVCGERQESESSVARSGWTQAHARVTKCVGGIPSATSLCWGEEKTIEIALKRKRQ